MIFEIDRERPPLAFVARAKSPRRNAGQIVVLVFHLRADIVTEQGEARRRGELVADLAVYAGEGNVGRCVDEVAKRCAGIERVLVNELGEDVVIDVLIEEADLEVGGPSGFSKGQVDGSRGLVIPGKLRELAAESAGRQQAELKAVRSEIGAAGVEFP